MNINNQNDVNNKNEEKALSNKFYVISENGLNKEDYDFLKRKYLEITEYFELRLMLTSHNDKAEFNRLSFLWNWSLLEFKNRFKTFGFSD